MFWIALELSIPIIGLNMLSLTVKKLKAFKFDGAAESDNTEGSDVISTDRNQDLIKIVYARASILVIFKICRLTVKFMFKKIHVSVNIVFPAAANVGHLEIEDSTRRRNSPQEDSRSSRGDSLSSRSARVSPARRHS